MEALGAVLAGSAEIDGETITVVADGPLADFADQVARTAAALRCGMAPFSGRSVYWRLAAAVDDSDQHRGVAVHGAVAGADPQEDDQVTVLDPACPPVLVEQDQGAGG